MRKVFNVLAVVFIIVSIAFVIFPMDTIGLIPVGIALVFGILAFVIAESEQKKFPKLLLIISGILLVIILARHFLIADEVADDPQSEQRKIERKTEDLKDLEEMEAQ
ncbi:MAG TPA: hypothetical protein VK528_00180 [Flavobacterium sp.]|nr:hypothetical protein [Flavobacterium sp.]